MRNIKILSLFIFCLVTACNSNAKEIDKAKNCNSIDYQSNDYFVCKFANPNPNLRLYLRDDDGDNIGNFNNLSDYLKTQNHKLVFAMNGGMYNDDRAPTGLYVENGKQITPIQTKKSYGNFGLLPNGVFYIDKGQAGVLESFAYLEKFKNAPPQFATQSGPMLVINGNLHPIFKADSTSVNIRNGVGISEDGKEVYFVISQSGVNFYDFATLFKDYLKTPNALFLDGSISKVYDEQSGRNDKGDEMGVMVGVYK